MVTRRRRRRRRREVTSEVVVLQLSVLDSAGAGAGTGLSRLAHWSLVARGLRSLLGQIGSSNHSEWVKLGDIFRWGRSGFSHCVRPLVLYLARVDVIRSSRLLLLGGLSLLLREDPLQEGDLGREESCHESSSLWFVSRHFTGHFLPVLEMMVRVVGVVRGSLISRLTIWNSGVEISERDLSQNY